MKLISIGTDAPAEEKAGLRMAGMTILMVGGGLFTMNQAMKQVEKRARALQLVKVKGGRVETIPLP